MGRSGVQRETDLDPLQQEKIREYTNLTRVDGLGPGTQRGRVPGIGISVDGSSENDTLYCISVQDLNLESVETPGSKTEWYNIH